MDYDIHLMVSEELRGFCERSKKKYNSKYLLDNLLMCGHCGDCYRRRTEIECKNCPVTICTYLENIDISIFFERIAHESGGRIITSVEEVFKSELYNRELILWNIY